MNLIVLQTNKLIAKIEYIKSDNLGLYFSFLLHSIILFLIIGVPNIFGKQTISVPTIIPIEIINVSDFTSIPKEIEKTKSAEVKKIQVKEKKFNSSNNQEIKKIKIKDKPKLKSNEIKKEIIPKDQFIIPEKKQILLEPQEKKIKIDNNIESIPSKKNKPKLKPKLKPQLSEVEKNIPKKSDILLKEKQKIIPENKQEFDIASMLKDLRNEKITQKIEKESLEDKKKDEIETPKNESSNSNAQLSISEIDLLRQQLSSCWIAPAGAVIEKGMLVKIAAKLKQNRRVISNSVRIIDTNISKSNSFYGPITESAMRTLLNPDCIPLKLPEDKYDLWKNLTITFDYSIMKGY